MRIGKSEIRNPHSAIGRAGTLKTADWEEWREKKIFKADDWRVEPVATQPVPPFRGASRYKHQTAADILEGGKRRRKAKERRVLGPAGSAFRPSPSAFRIG
jgi:hypothetical protein